MYYVYVIYNREADKFYIGQTKDLAERLELHNKKIFKNSYTSRFGGRWFLVYTEAVVDRKIALVRERQLKSFRGREFVKSRCSSAGRATLS
ncbi:MAG: GIY-YIG nuclease family protein [Candidatus Liptonbacteria bacterium]